MSGIGILFRKKTEMVPDPSWFRPNGKKIRGLAAYFTLFAMQSAVGHTVYIFLGPHERSLALRSPPTTSPPLPTRKDLENLTSCQGQIRHFLLPEEGNSVAYDFRK